MKKGKRILSLCLALLMSFGMFSGLSTTAFAASSEMTLYMIDLPRSADANKSGWGHPALSFLGGWGTASRDNFYSVFCENSYTGRVVYCIEPGVPCKTGDKYSGFDENFWDNYPSGLNPTISPTVMKAYIGRIMQYSWHGNGNTGWNSSNSSDANEIAHMIATQLLIWETVVGERDSQFGKVNANSQGKNNIVEQISSNHPLRNLIFSYYSSMEASVQQHTMLPSFFSRSSGSAGTYELKWNGTNYSTTLTDQSGVLGNYRFSSPNAGLNFSISGNTLTISCDKAPKGAISITAEKTGGQRRDVVVWSDGKIGSGTQDFTTYAAEVSDPVTGYLNLEVKTGNMKLVKTSEDGKVEGIRFSFSGDGYNSTKTTGANGVIDITDLNPGVYTVTEQSIDKYEPQAVQRVTIVSGQTSTVTFNNVLKRGDLKVTKTSEDKLVEGMKFHLYGTSLSGLAVDEYAVTDKDGIATFKNVLISGSSPYILEEVDTPIRYVIPEAQNATIKWNEVTNQSVSNILKKFRVTLTKSDVETGLPQGHASLAGATYGLFKGETLVDSYTTDANGQFTTGYYVCDEDWTVREINPSEGYLIDNTIHKVGASATLYTIELNTTANDVTEQVIKGNMALIKHTDDGSTQIETPEVGAEFAVYLKAAGSYDNAKETERDYLTCDENGLAQTKDLPYGIYTVNQTKGWEGTEYMPDFDVYIAQDGATYRYLINNAMFESYIKVVKKDAETGNTIPYAGSGFQIYHPDGSLVTMSFTYPTPTTIDTFYTNADGYLVTPEKLPYGTGYSLVEVQAPYGYVLDKTPIYFDITQDGSTEDGGITVIEVVKPNVAQKGVVNIRKTGEVFSTVTTNGNLYQPVYEVKGLEGAVYEVTAAEDIYTLDGSLRASKGEVVDTVTTGAGGIATTKELYLGKYEVKEITAPHGMVLNSEIHSVELVYAGQEISVTETATSFYNQRQKVEIELAKAMESDDKFGIGANGEILDVTFGIFATEEITAADGTVIPADGLLEIVSVNADGTAKFSTDLPFGSYYVKELSTNAAYLPSDQTYPVIFEYAGQDTALVKLTANDGKPIENELIRGTVNGIKKDEDGKGLGGAVMGLFMPNTTEFTTENAILTATSNGDGSFSFADVPYGNYIVREIKAPTGFVLSETSFPVTIDKDGTEIEIELSNTRIRGNVQLTKVDKDYPDNHLSGAVFDVYTDSNGDKKFDKDDTLLGTMSELNGGMYQMSDLLYGGYFVKEKTAPAGFILDENAYYFAITENGKTVTVENEAGKGFINAAQKGSLKIVKTSSDKKVEGFSFRVTGVNYDQTFVTDKNGEIFIENLRIGEYTVSEVSNSASASYVLPADKQATVQIGSTTIVKMHNELRDTPKTGDDSNPALWFALMGISAVGAVTLGVLGFRKKKKEDEE
ncbi:MAG TPA: Cys-Gln thioester bond-forming surface protein [Clostridiales bacterium]|nr:Cys-Gln thioester bond-forming surface protein [Clostridiales bacterium]